MAIEYTEVNESHVIYFVVQTTQCACIHVHTCARSNFGDINCLPRKECPSGCKLVCYMFHISSKILLYTRAEWKSSQECSFLCSTRNRGITETNTNSPPDVCLFTPGEVTALSCIQEMTYSIRMTNRIVCVQGRTNRKFTIRMKTWTIHASKWENCICRTLEGSDDYLVILCQKHIRQQMEPDIVHQGGESHSGRKHCSTPISPLPKNRGTRDRNTISPLLFVGVPLRNKHAKLR